MLEAFVMGARNTAEHSEFDSPLRQIFQLVCDGQACGPAVHIETMRKNQPVLFACCSNIIICFHFHNMDMLNSAKHRQTNFAFKRFIELFSLQSVYPLNRFVAGSQTACQLQGR